MRYTESRLARAAMPLLDDIDKDTVDFRPNYDESKRRADRAAGALPEPPRQRRRRHRGRHGDQHPAAQSRRGHRRLHRLHRRTRTISDRGPDRDHPGPGLPDRRARSSAARARARPTRPAAARSSCGRTREIEEIRKEREAIIFTEIPYQVNKATLIEKIAELVREKKHRGHLGPARRIRPRRHAHRHRAEARRGRRRGAEPALPLHAAADELRRQHGGAERRPAGADDPEGPHPRLRRFPRGGRLPAHQVPARQGPRARPRAVRPRDRRRQHRRGDPPHPRGAGPERRARGPDGPRLAGARHRAADRARRRPAPRAQRGRHLPPLGGAGPRHPRPAPAAPHRARPRRDRRRAAEARGRDLGLSRHPALARPDPGDHQGRARRRSATPSRRRAGPRSSTGTPTSTTRT